MLIFLPLSLFPLFPLSSWNEVMKIGGMKARIRFPLSYLARDYKRVDVMRNFSIVSVSSAEHTLLESSILPMRRIKKGRNDLGESLVFCFVFFLPPFPTDQLQCLVVLIYFLFTTYLAFLILKTFWPACFQFSLLIELNFWVAKNYILGLSLPAFSLLSRFFLYFGAFV